MIINEEYQLVDVEKLRPHPQNPRVNDLGAIRESIDINGFYGALVVNKPTGHILAGNHRYKAALEQQIKALPVIYVDVDESTALRIMAADNRTSDLGGYDDHALATLLKSLPSLEGTGYDDGYLTELLDGLMAEIEPLVEEGDNGLDAAQELQKKWQTARGQIYTVGSHRIMCGDSTNPDDTKSLFDDAQHTLCWTDPPYGVSYKGKTKDALTIEHDELQSEELNEFLKKAFSLIAEHAQPGAPIYVCHPAGPIALQFMIEFNDIFSLRQGLVWDKETMVMGRSDYHYAHEPILYGFVRGGAGRLGRGGTQWHGGNNKTSVLRHQKPSRNKHHPTMKPIPLIEECIMNSSKRGKIVYDPFLGSGSTALACESTGRICYGMEYDPKYFAVCLQRLTEMGLEAKLVK